MKILRLPLFGYLRTASEKSTEEKNLTLHGDYGIGHRTGNSLKLDFVVLWVIRLD